MSMTEAVVTTYDLRSGGVPRFRAYEFSPKASRYALLIPVLNEGGRILSELARAKAAGVSDVVDIALLDSNSTDGSTEEGRLRALSVNSLLEVDDEGQQGAAYRTGFYWAMQRGYEGVVTVDGNDKDSVEDIPRFVARLEEGYDFVQGSRFCKGGRAIRTPLFRRLAITCVHAPVISLCARFRFTDTTNAFRAYSMRYLADPRVQPFRDIFKKWEILDYLSVRASRLGLRVCEIPVTRSYPESGEIPTKIHGADHLTLLADLIHTALGHFDPPEEDPNG